MHGIVLICVAGLVADYAKLGNKEKAMLYLQELYDTREAYFEFLDHPEDKHCLMFVEGDMDGYKDATREEVNKRVAKAKKIVEQIL